MRITGLATGLDMDEVIKESMRPYRVKIQQQQQQKEIVEIKQKLYRDVLKDSRELYNKYFDVSKSDSIVLSKNWSTIKFESSDSNVVSVSANSEAVNKNFTITGSSATATKATLTEGIGEGDKIVVDGKEFTLSGSTDRERVSNLNKELEKAGIKVCVSYTDFAGSVDGENKKGLIFESTVLGEKGSFTLGGSVHSVNIEEVKGSNATEAKFTGITIKNIRDSKEIKIGDKVIGLNLDSSKEYTKDELVSELNKKLEEEKIDFRAKVDEDNNVTLVSTKSGELTDLPTLEITLENNSIVNGAFENGNNATKSITSLNLSEIEGKVLFIDGKKVEFSLKDSILDLDALNKSLEEKNLNVSAEIKDGKLSLISKTSGESKSLDISVIEEPAEGFTPIIQGKDANIIIKDSKGGVYTHKGDSNVVTLDGVTFKFDGEIPADGIKITSKKDSTKTKEMVVNFFNDYNKLMEKLNTLTMEKRDRSYSPLTDEQKKEMSESEIKLWNERVEKGQLSRDSDLSRIINSLKNAMTTMVDGIDINLEDIGVKPVSDYGGVKNGTFTIDENKLTAALEEDPNKVMRLFTATPTDSKNLTSAEKNSKSGIAQRLKSILYDETMTVSARLLKKAGYEGTTTVTNNELTKSIEKYERKVKDMEKAFSKKEQALYSKYATLETMMNQLNSQQSYLLSQLGMA
ncbi:flagellar filament capping protein FliD [Clostridium paraputrificum]|uniref:flagellar filament capping protein FliD n=1 Tax=Clostridium paraputrificum TaxID=29363 RepID=UPI0006BF71BC|nr:flagellar filament capping protein FliD [Clostridium paraputrificum]MDU1406408.1 flagellar filament capping protein FliD [Clostridium sp.]MDU2993233.1 flagellar filament capping protein FliD [Clostridium sp.]CUN85946.1 flagellar cap protein FliD [Clostridium paraputrificum]